MGMSKSVAFDNAVPSWQQIQSAAAQAGLPLSLRMIDNLPAFPDELPEEGWQELRVGSPHGMMTLRKARKSIDCTVWGNADGQLQSDWLRLAQILSGLDSPS